ncbi:MAG: GAF domain-containing protein [Syntrophobacteraceae bacterium]
MFFVEEFSKRTIIQLRWTLIISIGYITMFSQSDKSFPLVLNVFLPLYALTNIILFFGPEKWFRTQEFIYSILLLDLSMTILTIVMVGPKDSEFYITFFLILLMSAISRKAILVYSTFGIILIAYGVTSYLKSYQAFFSTHSLLQFPFILILAIFFRSMVISYNRVHQENELLKEDYRELEVLNSVALSIGEHKGLSHFLFRLSSLLSEMLGIERCTVMLMDSKEDNCYMVSSDDLPGEGSNIINVADFPTLKESLKREEIPEEGEFPLHFQDASKHILKKIPIAFNGKNLGTLYLRASTPKHSLTHREEYFLGALGRITAIAILNVQRSKVLEKIIELPDLNVKSGEW